MTTQEFETQLQNLIKQAPADATIFMSYSNSITCRKVDFVQGTGLELISNLSICLADRDDLQEIFKLSIEASNQEFSKEFKRSLIDTEEN